MKIRERDIRRLVRESFEGFVSRVKEINPEDSDIHRKIKKIWNEEDDESFMRSLIKIHWFGKVTLKGKREIKQRVMSLVSSRGNEEISAMAYVSPPFNTTWGDVGVVIDGIATLAANDMNAIVSGYYEHDATKRSGKFRKRSQTDLKKFAGELIDKFMLDRGSFRPEMQGRNEVVVANWRVKGLVISEHLRKSILDSLRKSQNESMRLGMIISDLRSCGVPFAFDFDREAIESEEASRLVEFVEVAEITADEPERLRLLSRDPNVLVRRIVAKNSSTPPDALQDMLSDPDEEVRAAAAVHPSVSLDELKEKILDENESVKMAILSRKDVPVDILTILARDPDDSIRLVIASMGSLLPPEVIEILSSDDDPVIASLVLDTL